MVALLLLVQVFHAEQPGEREFSRKLDGLEAMTAGVWVRPRTKG
jgi:hypothetical protein